MKIPDLLAVLIAGALVFGCSQKEQSQPAAATTEKSAESQSRVRLGTNGNEVMTLDAATQKLMGLQTAPLPAATLSPEMKGYGHVLDVSGLVSIVADLATARAASDASQAELRRLKILSAQNNASERALQAAEAAAVRDQAQAESTRLKLVSDWGGAIAGRDNLTALVQSLASLRSALVRIDLPAGEALKEGPADARLLTLATGAPPIDAQLVGPAPMVDPQFQGLGLFFLVVSNQSQLSPGTAVTAYLALPGEPQSGVAVPREAIVRYNGTTWVYRQTGEQTFERQEVTLVSPEENGWFVREQLKPEDKVVIAGSQQMLSEELKGQGTD